jgi:hypothetical protein
MKFLEFHFNPKLAKKKDIVFDTFCFVPETKDEENLGYLYLIGELKNVLPKTQNLLNTLSEIIKREFYKVPSRGAQESFKESLNRANEFLAREIKKENVSWLGNLNFAVISLTSDFSINFSKVGNFKILLLREKEIYNIGESINFTSSSAKVFPNVVEGKLREGDKIVVVTREVFEAFEKEGIFQDLAEAKKRREFKKIFQEKKKTLREIFGACLLIIPEKKGILFKKIYFPKISFSLKKLPPFSSLLEKISPQSPILQEKLKKGLVAILILAILLFLGWLIFR